MLSNLVDEPIYPVDEAAEVANLSSYHIWTLLRLGKLKRTKVGGKTYVRASELRKLVVETVNEPRVKPARKSSKKATAAQ